MRSAGCAFNDWADRDFDAHVKRTADRPLAAGVIAPWEALVVGAVLALVAFALRADHQPRDDAVVDPGARHRDRVSVLQALLRAAAGVPRHRVLLRHPDGVRRRAQRGAALRLGAARDQSVLGRSPTTPNTRWSTATTTSASASARRRSRSAASTSPPSRSATRSISPGMVARRHAASAWAPLYFAGLAVALAIAVYHVWLIRTRDRDACFRAFLAQSLAGPGGVRGRRARLRDRPRALAAHAVTAAPAPRRRGLPPVLAADARVLILGSFPSEASLARAQYYAHPRNHFWPLLGALLDEPLAALPYPQRLARVRAHGVAIWDTIVACERAGSLDAAIRNAERGEIARVRRVAQGLARRGVQRRHGGAGRACVARRGLRDARAAVDQPGVHAAVRRKARRVAGAVAVARRVTGVRRHPDSRRCALRRDRAAFMVC